MHRILMLLAFLLTAGAWVSGTWMSGALMSAAEAVEPDEILDDPVLEARARGLSAGIRCLVCQNESIDSSNADMARDLRILVRDRLQAGDSDQAVLDYLVARYGDFVLLNPPLKPATYILWYGPGLLLLLGFVGVVVFLRRQRGRSPAAASGLSADERMRLRALLEDNDEAPQGGKKTGNGA